MSYQKTINTKFIRHKKCTSNSQSLVWNRLLCFEFDYVHPWESTRDRLRQTRTSNMPSFSSPVKPNLYKKPLWAHIFLHSNSYTHTYHLTLALHAYGDVQNLPSSLESSALIQVNSVLQYSYCSIVNICYCMCCIIVLMRGHMRITSRHGMVILL